MKGYISVDVTEDQLKLLNSILDRMYTTQSSFNQEDFRIQKRRFFGLLDDSYISENMINRWLETRGLENLFWCWDIHGSYSLNFTTAARALINISLLCDKTTGIIFIDGDLSYYFNHYLVFGVYNYDI